MVAAVILGLTGATGFVGNHLVDAAVAAGHKVQALTRTPLRNRRSVRWVHGDLADSNALAELAEGAGALIHVAGRIRGRTAADFDAVNVAGTAAVLEAARAAGVRRFVHVSSLAAREPRLSLYGASKAKSEALVEQSDLKWAIVRPPAVYGPGDRETLALFKMANFGLVLLPPAGRLSLIHVDDLAGLLLALADPSAPDGLVVEPDDGRPGGWSHDQLGRALGEAVRRRGLCLSMPRPLLRAAAAADQLVRRSGAKLTRDRAAYFCHPDWVAGAAHRPPPELWRPQVPTDEGLAQTAAWYRERGWL